ncbi:MAG: M14 family metallopeptidase, partial [Bullifex sp.]
FWPIDNTDINRMFPGYDKGETTQRIAAALFDRVRNSRYGIQFASFYMPGTFVPHVRMMKTGYEDLILAKQFGLPYVILHNPRPFDTATLNYNWQIWDTKAFSIYTTSTAEIDQDSSRQAIEAILNFLSKEGIIRYTGREGYISRVVETSELITLRAENAGFLETLRKGGDNIQKGETLARILDTYTSEVLSEIKSPVDGIIEFSSNEALTYENTTIFKLIKDED